MRTCLLLLFCMGSAFAEPMEQIHQEGEQKLREATRSQGRIDTIVAGAQERLILYRSLLKQAEGLETYNEQLSAQVDNQGRLLSRLSASLTQVTLIERQMSPLIAKMTESLTQFIARDLPFHYEERQERLAFLMENQKAADIDVAEKFRQIIEAYQIENQYGRKIDTYNDLVRIDGQSYEVDVLRIGRIVLLCQTRDSGITAYWDNTTKQWQRLDSAIYRNPVRYAIKMARKQVPINLITLPIHAPEDTG